MRRENWDDLRFALAVAESGSVSAAARRLGVNHATVLRRMAAFEDRHGEGLFARTSAGYVLPADRARVVAALQDVESAVEQVRRLLSRSGTEERGRTVRVTSTDTLCQVVLPRIAADLLQPPHAMRIELISANSHLDMARLDADVAVRPAVQLPSDLSGAVGADLGFAVYASNNSTMPWLGVTGALSRSKAAEWLSMNVPADRIGAASDSFLALRAMAAEGMGRAILPCILGDGDARLVRMNGAVPEFSVPIWVASHVDVAEMPRFAEARRLIAQSLARMKPALSGLIA